MTAPSDATRRPHRPPGRLPNNPNPVDPQSDTRRIVTITEDTQQPSITKPAQQPGRPTSICKRRLNLDFLVQVARARFKQVREILDRQFERDTEQHSDHEFQRYRLPSPVCIAIQLTVKNSRYDVFERFLVVLRKDPELRRAYNDLKHAWHLRPMHDYRVAKGKFIENALKRQDD